MGTIGPSNLVVRFIAVRVCILQSHDNVYETFMEALHTS